MKKIINLVCGTLTVFLMASCSSGGGTKSYQITFYDDAQNVLETAKVEEGKIPSYSKGTPTKQDTESTIYTFDGWIPEIKAASANASYYASFNAELRKYTVTFDSDGGTEVAPSTVEWGKRLSGITNPSKADSGYTTYTFAYWYDSTGSEETPFKMSTEIKRDYSLKAKWVSGVKSYTVSFDTAGGSLVNSQKVVYNGYAEEPEDPTHASSLSTEYTFDGWYESPVFLGEEFDFNTPITSNITLYAKWIETAREYTVTFYSGDEVFDTKTVVYKGKVTAPVENPTRDPDEVGQYTFKKWDFDFDTPIIGNVDIHAVYDINYIYYHYTALNSTCSAYGCKEFYGTKSDVYSMELPTQYYNIIEAGQATKEMLADIIAKDPKDERIIAFAHEFDDITGLCIHGCGTQSITGSALDTSKLSRTDLYTCPLEYGNMYKYDGSPVDIFSAYPLDGLTEIKFYLANPDANNSVILNGNGSACVGGVYGGPETFDGIIAKKDGNDWTVTRKSGKTMFTLPSWANQPNYTINNPTTVNQIFDTFSYGKVVYISDIIVSGTPSEQKELLNNAYFVGTSGGNTYSLTDTGEKVTGLGKKYEYKCLNASSVAKEFRELFNDIDITDIKTVSFYIDINKDNYLTFVDDNGKDDATSEAYGLHGKDGAHVPGIIKAYNEGNGTWKVTATGLQFRKINGGTKTNEFTYHNRNTLKALFNIGTVNSWQKATMYVSDVVITK